MQVTIIPIVIGTLGTVTKGVVQRLEGPSNKRTSGDYPNYSIAKIGQNPGDLRRLAVTETPEKGHQLMVMRKTLKE